MNYDNHNISRKIALLCNNINVDSIDSETVDRCKYFLLDFLGCAIRGTIRQSTQPVLKIAEQKLTLDDQVPIFGSSLKSEVSYAALAIGTAAHSLELDDVVNSASLHPAVSVMPAALTVGYTCQSSGKELLSAIVAGYELTVKLGIALNPAAHYRQGFHPTGTCGTFGAAVAAGKMLKLNQNELLNSIGIAGSQAAGSMEFLTDGAFTKRFHAGWSAHSGIVAASLAKEGFTGPCSILEGKFGFLHGYSQESNPAHVLQNWGNPWEVTNTSIKPHACCRYKQGPIDCILKIIEENNLQPDQIDIAETAILDAGFALVAEPERQKRNPQSVVDAQFSMPFGAALAILRKNAFLDRYSLDEINNPAIKDMMKRVSCVRDESINKDFPKKWPARVEIRTRDGKVFNEYLEHPKGDPENPLSWDELIKKFKALASKTFSDSKCDEIVGLVRQVDQLDNIAELIDKLQLD